MPPQQSPAPQPIKPKNQSGGWQQVHAKARVIASVSALFLALILLGAGGAYFYLNSQVKAPAEPKLSVSNLTPEDIAKLGEVGNNLGSSGQTLNIGADALFRSAVNVTGDTTIGGRLTSNGTASLNGLNLSGAAAGTSLNLSSNLNVGGTSTMQQSLTVAGLTTLSGGLNAGGNTSVNALNATSIAVRNITISGPLTVAHLVTQGPVPILVTGPAVGGGGTSSISGNDTAGTVTFNTGSGPSAGVLGTVTFRAAYTAGVHVLLSPITAGAASTSYYVTRTSGGFQIHAASPAPAGTTISFDYLVTQ